MKTATLPQIRKEINQKSPDELRQLCLRLGRFKKENKELLTYLLFESDYEAGYVESVKDTLNGIFESINSGSYFYMKKTVRKALRETKKYARYSGNKETEVALLLHFCKRVKDLRPRISRHNMMRNLYLRQIEYIAKKIDAMHEDLQLDYRAELDPLRELNDA
ncbi:MAG: hypothetical protein WBG71_00455 [Leeuwenhoekiella sp.]